MVCNKFASRPRRPHYVCATFFLRPTSSYYVLTTSLLRPYCVLIPPRPRHVSFEHVQNLTKTFASIKTSLRPYYVPTTSYKTVPRPHYVLIFLGRSKDVVRTWPGVDVTLEPPRRGGSNEYPQSMFWSKNKKNRHTPAYPSFTI